MPQGDNGNADGGVGRRRFLQSTGAASVAVGVAGCGGEDATPTEGEDTDTPTPTETPTPPEGSDITEGGTFTYGLAHKPDTANRTQASSVYSAVALNLIYEGPVASDPETYEPRPWIYTDWEIEETYTDDDDRDVLVARWNMRGDMEFGDGEPVTKEDILFSYNYIVNNEIGQYSGLLGSVLKNDDGSPMVSQADSGDWDFRGEFYQSYAWEFTTIGALDILPKHIWEGKDPEQYDPMADDAVVGTGPGKLTKFDPDTSMQVEIVNDTYRETVNQQDWVEENDMLLAGGPFVDEFNFKVYGSDSAMTNAFLEGEVDTHYGSLAQSRVSEVEDEEGLGTIEAFGSGFNYFGFQLRRPPLDDACFRQALNFCWDNFFWVNTLQAGSVLDGDYPQSPGYTAGRPELYHDDAEMLEAPETELYNFRQAQEGVVDVEGIRNFLEAGQVADGSGGTYAGQDYPGTLFDDVSADQSEAKYSYSFGEVVSDVFESGETDQEIRVDGQTIPEMMDGDELVIITDPPSEKPRQIKAVRDWASKMRQVGIPIRTETLSFNTIVNRTAYTQDFDINELGWGGTSAYGASNYFFFHSRWATDGDENYDYNSTGYGDVETGADELLEDAYTTLDTEEAAKKFAKSMEKVYLDSPYRVWNYGKDQWPVNTSDWKGYVKGLVDPAYASWTTEANNVNKKE